MDLVKEGLDTSLGTEIGLALGFSLITRCRSSDRVPRPVLSPAFPRPQHPPSRGARLPAPKAASPAAILRISTARADDPAVHHLRTQGCVTLLRHARRLPPAPAIRAAGPASVTRAAVASQHHGSSARCLLSSTCDHAYAVRTAHVTHRHVSRHVIHPSRSYALRQAVVPSRSGGCKYCAVTSSIRHFHRLFLERLSRGTTLDQQTDRESLSRQYRPGYLQRSATGVDPKSSSLRTSPFHPWSHLLKAGIYSSHRTNPKGVSPRALFPTNSSSKRYPLESPGEFLSGVPPRLEHKNSLNASGPENQLKRAGSRAAAVRRARLTEMSFASRGDAHEENQQADYLLPSSIDLDGCGLRIYETEIPSDSELISIDPAIDPLIDADLPALRQ
ncbi:unnamed protein product [Bemisia tabaci]|uniref:Uncharacterized protein n=1 Tax=Bemisia tabaci TaxID=7038 RepID=A0A9P0ABI8_BEMTA|nr:unnamed protein product [Bemisia tabaci]